MKNDLQGKRILVPASRVGINVLARMLERTGAEVVVFPELRGAPPSDELALQRAADGLQEFDWVVFAGALAVEGLVARLARKDPDACAELSGELRVGAIGAGAVAALRRCGARADYAPRVHTAAEVVAGMGEVTDLRVLLVRAEGAPAALPEALRAAGAHASDVAGFRVIVEVPAAATESLGQRAPDAVALASPSAVRLLLRAAAQAGLDLRAHLGHASIAAVGPATAEVARRHGLLPDLVSGGRLAGFVSDLAMALTDSSSNMD